MYLILLRHGQSAWNKKNIFTGWVDIPLTREGIEEALSAGRQIAHIPIDYIYTSTLIRAQMTTMLAMSQHSSDKVPYILHPNEGRLESWSRIYGEEAKKNCIPVTCAWQLNERMYGTLQGLNKEETKKEFGQEQVQIWRRGYQVAPPEGESLEMTAERTIPYLEEEIIPHLTRGENVLISAHGNSLRAIVMYLKKLNQEEVLKLEIPTGQALLYRYELEMWHEADLSR